MTLAPTRLQLGTSRLEHLSTAALSVFLNDSWLHLGESDPVQLTPAERFRAHMEHAGFRSAILKAPRAVLKRDRPAGPAPDVSVAKFAPFHFGIGAPISCPDSTFDFVFAEHFVEHLFLDEALFLMDDVFRLLRPGGVFRLVCPDADLRRNGPPEPAGFPDENMPWSHPDKHKSRWSVRSLPEVLRRAGFEPNAVRYYSVSGELCVHGGDSAAWFPEAREQQLLLRTDYLQRPESLIVDAFKPTPDDQTSGGARQ